MPDFNSGAPGGGDYYDRDLISAALRLCAYRWVPELFPQGRIQREGGHRTLRVADISGRPPGKFGSCVIDVDGDDAGNWKDFSIEGSGGGPLSLLKEHFKIGDAALFAMAADICREYGMGDYLTGAKPLPVAVKPKPNGSAAEMSPAARAEISDLINQGGPLAGTVAETYWNARKLGPLPPASGTDLLFCGNANYWDNGIAIGWPAIVARLRYPDGSYSNGIHRIYLERDGSWHVGRKGGSHPGRGKLSLGPFDFTVVMLAQPGPQGALGVGEGIETTAAGMVMFGVPGWATLSNGGMDRLAETIRGGRLTAAIKRLLVWADAGNAGEGSACNLALAAMAAGMAAELYLPASGDDMAADLAAGLPPPEPLLGDQIREHAASLPVAASLLLAAGPATAGAEGAAKGVAGQPGEPMPSLETRVRGLQPNLPGAVYDGAVAEICNTTLNDPAGRDQLLKLFRQCSGLRQPTIDQMVRAWEHNSARTRRGWWAAKLAVNDEGEPKGIMSNCAIVFREADEWKDVLWFDDFTREIWFKRRPPYENNPGVPCYRVWEDADELSVTEWMQSVAGIHARKDVVFDAVLRVALEHKFHQVRDYLVGLVWDGVSRLDDLPVKYLGYDPDGPKDETEDEMKARYKRNAYVWASAKKWMIGAVARIFRPGIKNDTMLILVGFQGFRKSTAIKRLTGEEWFTDEMPMFGTKDAAIQIRGKWIIEVSELDSMKVAELSKVKAFASRGTDRYRPPYGRSPIDVPRECAFVGACNEMEFLHDMTGARRYWPNPVHKRIDLALIERDRDQLWAEAVHLYMKGEIWYFDENSEAEIIEASEIEQEARRQHDSWEAPIENWLNGQKPYTNAAKLDVSTGEVLMDALFISDKSKWGRGEEMRIGKILQKLGWVRKLKRIEGGKPSWRYFRPLPPATT